MSATVSQVGPLALRSLKRTVRQPALLASGLLFPLFFYGFTVGGLAFATKLPGFPTDSYATFGLSFTFGFAGLYAVMVAGSQLGEDIRTGFIKRQALTPLRGGVLLVGHLGGVVVFAAAQAVIFLGVGLAAGARIQAGPGGAVLIVLLAACFALAFGAIGLMSALLVRSGEAVAALFPMVTALLLLSSVNLPRELVQIRWYQELVTFNPVSYLVEAPRSLMVTGWQAQPLLLGIAVTVAIFVTALLQTAGGLRALAVRR